MAKPLVMIVKEHGTNCEHESKFAFEQAGAEADIVHMNDWIKDPEKIHKYQIAMFPGGFSYGDDTGSAYAWANRIKNNLHDDMLKFAENNNNLVLGVCNGFQLLVNFGLLPGLDGKYDVTQAALMHNDKPRYQCRWVDLEIKSHSPWLKGLTGLMVPIAHGEGKFFAEEDTLKAIKEKNLVAARYTKGVIHEYEGLPANPNGSLDDIAAVSDASGRILGMMPHPERAIDFTHLPHWTYIKSLMKRTGEKIPTEGPGMYIFRNAVEHFKES